MPFRRTGAIVAGRALAVIFHDHSQGCICRNTLTFRKFRRPPGNHRIATGTSLRSRQNRFGRKSGKIK